MSDKTICFQRLCSWWHKSSPENMWYVQPHIATQEWGKTVPPPPPHFWALRVQGRPRHGWKLPVHHLQTGPSLRLQLEAVQGHVEGEEGGRGRAAPGPGERCHEVLSKLLLSGKIIIIFLMGVKILKYLLFGITIPKYFLANRWTDSRLLDNW